MSKYDWKYIFKKVLIFFIIFVLLSLLQGCTVFAAETGGRFVPTTETYQAISGTSNVNFTIANQVQIANNSFNNRAWSGSLATPQTFKITMQTPNINADSIYILGYGIGTQVTGCYSLGFYKCEVYNNYVAQAPDLSLNSTWAIKISLSTPLRNQSWSGEIFLQLSGFGNSGATSFAPQLQVMVWKYYSIGETNDTVIDAIEDTTSSINELKDSINDDNVSGASSEVDDLLDNSAFDDNSGIQSIINAPLNLIQNLSNACTPINLTIPFIDTNVTLPCIKQELTNRVPTLVSVLSTAINGFIIYRILLDIVSIIKSAREPDEDRIEVLDL